MANYNDSDKFIEVLIKREIKKKGDYKGLILRCLTLSVYYELDHLEEKSGQNPQKFIGLYSETIDKNCEFMDKLVQDYGENHIDRFLLHFLPFFEEYSISFMALEELLTTDFRNGRSKKDYSL